MHSIQETKMADRKRAHEQEEEEDNKITGEALQETKKAKLEGQGEGLESFKGFKISKTLSQSSSGKTVFVHGTFEDGEEDAVVLLEKTPFSQDTLSRVLSSDTKLKVDMRNDIYGQYACSPPQDINTVKCTVIYPATSKHIQKYTSQNVFLVTETPEDYDKITLPFLEKQQFSIQWVYNILEKKAEADRIIYEDPDEESGFVLLPDMKWDQKQTENLYLVVICHKKGIKSIRDLDERHLPLLKNILNKGTETIVSKYNIPASQLRIYIHYQPSYYHFHVHFTHLRFDAPGSNIGKAHLLTDVIDNIENVDKNFYQKKTLSFVAKENDKLFMEFKEAGRV